MRERGLALHGIAEETDLGLKSVVQPPPIPSFPTEALSFLSMRQMAPDVLVHPVFDEAEGFAGMPHSEHTCIDPRYSQPAASIKSIGRQSFNLKHELPSCHRRADLGAVSDVRDRDHLHCPDRPARTAAGVRKP